MSRFHPRRFLDLAEGLLAGRDEASLRSAVSRAYYGVFLEARDLLGMTHMGSQVHGEAQQLLGPRPLGSLVSSEQSVRWAALRLMVKCADVSNTAKSVHHAVRWGLAIVTEWNEYRTPDFDYMRHKMKSAVIFDGRNLYNAAKMVKAGWTYSGIGLFVPR